MNILITGASRGIGRAIVYRFAADKGNHIIAIARDEKALEDMHADALNKKLAGKISILPFDLNYLMKENDLAEQVQSILGTVDILINNAGYLVMKAFTGITKEELQASVTVNFAAPALLIRDLIPLMGKNGTSHVVNISSMGGYQGSVKFPGLSMYSASKGALAVLTECLAEEYKEKKIVFNCLALGAVQTEMLEEAFPGYKAPIEVNDMADFIADFSISGPRFFNGKILPVSSTTP